MDDFGDLLIFVVVGTIYQVIFQMKFFATSVSVDLELKSHGVVKFIAIITLGHSNFLVQEKFFRKMVSLRNPLTFVTLMQFTANNIV